MIVSVSGRTMRASFAQPSKALAPIDVTDSGIVTVRISSQPRKASGAIFVTWDVLGCFLLCPLPPLFYCKRPSHPIPGVRGQRTPPSGHHPATVPPVRTSTRSSARSIGSSHSLPSSSIARNSFTVFVGTTVTLIISSCKVLTFISRAAIAIYNYTPVPLEPTKSLQDNAINIEPTLLSYITLRCGSFPVI